MELALKIGILVITTIATIFCSRLHFAAADDPNYGPADFQKGEVFRGIVVPGNYIGNAPQTVPGVGLPMQDRRQPDKIPFSPTDSVFGNTAIVDPNNNAWSYGQAYHGVNPLNLNARNLYDAYKDASAPVKTDGQSFPFDHVFNTGGVFDTQSTTYTKGGLNVPVLARKWPNLFDLTGNVMQNGDSRQVNVDMPLVGTNQRLPIDGQWTPNNVTTYQFGQAIPNVNPFKLSKQQIMDRLANGQNADPTFVGG